MSVLLALFRQQASEEVSWFNFLLFNTYSYRRYSVHISSYMYRDIARYLCISWYLYCAYRLRNFTRNPSVDEHVWRHRNNSQGNATVKALLFDSGGEWSRVLIASYALELTTARVRPFETRSTLSKRTPKGGEVWEGRSDLV